MKRRTLMIGAGAAALAAGVGLERHRLFGKHYPATPYDDLLGQVIDRDAAATLGRAIAPLPPAAASANRLRSLLGAHGLTAAATADAAQGRIMEVDGWQLPQSVALMAALAAKV